jgi:hypothetical protein
VNFLAKLAFGFLAVLLLALGAQAHDIPRHPPRAPGLVPQRGDERKFVTARGAPLGEVLQPRRGD